MHARPKGLPEFTKPPLAEVVLGVQFQPLQAYQSVHAGLLWEVLQGRYSSFRDQPTLPPTFETFSKRPFPQGMPFTFSDRAEAPRVWFLSSDGSELFQFQADRATHNWRVLGEAREYPRYENVRSSFAKDLELLSEFTAKQKLGSLVVNQAEISYVNVIQSKDGKEQSIHDLIGSVFPLWSDGAAKAIFPGLESASFRMSSVLRVGDKPVGRLHAVCDPVMHVAGGDALKLELIVRGLPVGESIADALAFLDFGRECIVNAFAALTSAEYHKEWGRVT